MSDHNDGLLREPNQALDVTHHDDPARHIIGGTLLPPGPPKPILNTITGASAGISDAVAREDHVHAGPGFIVKFGTTGPLVTNAGSVVTFFYPQAFPTACDALVPGVPINGVAAIFTLLLVAKNPNAFQFRVDTPAGAPIGAGFTAEFDFIAYGH